jgi:hypothetical protein
VGGHFWDSGVGDMTRSSFAGDCDGDLFDLISPIFGRPRSSCILELQSLGSRL